MTRCFQQCVAVILLSVTGCALLNRDPEKLLSPRDRLDPHEVSDFERQLPTRKIVRLETSTVSGLATDRRIRELVWEELDESGLMSPMERRRLNESGIRVGVSGGTLPWALESLLRGERVNGQPSVHSQRRPDHSDGRSSCFGSHVAISEGSNSIIELPVEGGSLIIPDDRIAGMKHGGELKDARCVLQMTATEYGDGWVVIRFLPQIHHGTKTMRYSISESGERMPVRQRIQPLYEQQFELKLHTNETVVIGHQEQEEWTVGRLLFQSDSLSSKSERLLAFQLKEIEEITGRNSMMINYSKY